MPKCVYEVTASINVLLLKCCQGCICYTLTGNDLAKEGNLTISWCPRKKTPYKMYNVPLGQLGLRQPSVDIYAPRCHI